MIFYRSPAPIKAISFDLDDTLYNNQPVMYQLEHKLIAHLHQHEPLKMVTVAEFAQLKQSVYQRNTLLCDDVIAWRRTTLNELMSHYNIAEPTRSKWIEQAMDSFIYWRHQITVPTSSIELLRQLGQRYRLVVISNGNVIIKKLGLEPLFEFALRGGEQERAKPYPAIFHLAAERLQLPVSSILHVGDHLVADVKGAIDSGMQACWLNYSGRSLYQQAEACVLPHIEIKSLAALKNLL